MHLPVHIPGVYNQQTRITSLDFDVGLLVTCTTYIDVGAAGSTVLCFRVTPHEPLHTKSPGSFTRNVIKLEA